MAGLKTGFPLSRQQGQMLDELKAYLDENFSPDHECLVGNPEWDSEEAFQWARVFDRKLFDDGWLCPQWPDRYGGRGLTQVEQVLIREEFAYRRVPVGNANGLDMLSPILLRYGTEEQKAEHLVKIARMEEMWCQGFSEPEGGSDLTHLRTTAVRDGDEYVVNGSKIWTGHAVHADWMVLLCRTNPEERGSRGLSMLMVDLRNTPGVEIHPIRHMTGGVMFCQEFFMDARVPVENLVGPENGGWAAAATLLEHERSLIGGIGMATQRRLLDDILAMVAQRGGVHGSLAVEVGKVVEQVEAAQAVADRAAAYLGRGEGYPQNMANVLKLAATEVGRQLAELASELLGLGIIDFRLADRPSNFWQMFLRGFVSCGGGGSDELLRDSIAAQHFNIPVR
jgi:alkylation response protein AidB-like acyl-CoA dehydrogenase